MLTSNKTWVKLKPDDGGGNSLSYKIYSDIVDHFEQKGYCVYRGYISNDNDSHCSIPHFIITKDKEIFEKKILDYVLHQIIALKNNYAYAYMYCIHSLLKIFDKTTIKTLINSDINEEKITGRIKLKRERLIRLMWYNYNKDKTINMLHDIDKDIFQ